MSNEIYLSVDFVGLGLGLSVTWAFNLIYQFHQIFMYTALMPFLRLPHK